MGLWSTLRDRIFPVYRRPPAIAEAAGRVELTGAIELLDGGEPLACPLTGEAAVAVHYRARAPGIVSRAYGGMLGDTLDIGARALEHRDFILRDASGAALIRIARGGDVDGLHRRLLDEHGLGLRAETELLGPGDRVRVRGEVVERARSDSPHRRGPIAVVVSAETISRIDDAQGA